MRLGLPQAQVESIVEAILHVLVAAVTLTGRDGNALPLDNLAELLAHYRVIAAD